MARSKTVTKENKEDILVSALLTCPNVSEVAKKTGISRTAIYEYMKKDSFQEKLAEARKRALDDTIAYMQGCLSECAQVLMEIVRDKNAAPQIKINAANAVFMNVKGLTSESDKLFAGMAVKIIDSI